MSTEWHPSRWRYPSNTRAIDEYFRHRGQCNVLWLDGHVSTIRTTEGEGVGPAWYNGR